MWILLIKVCTFVAAWVGLMRARKGWKGTPQMADSGAYEMAVTHGKKPLFGDAPVQAIKIAVPAPPVFEFVLRRENAYDRLSKRIGLVVEQQVSDETFNRAVYVDCDDPGLAQLLNEQQDMRRAILGVFSVGASRGYQVESIICHKGRLWCVIKPWRKHDDPTRYAVASLVPVLHRLVHNLPERSSVRRRRRDELVPGASLMQWIARGAAIAGILYLLGRAYFPGRLLEPFDLFKDCVWPGVGFYALFAILALRVLRRCADTHRMMIEMTLLGLPGFVISTFMFASLINVNLDFSQSESYFLRNAQTYTNPASERRGSTLRYYVRASPWPKDSPLHEPFEIDAANYRRLPDRGDMLVTIRTGVFGHAWIAFVIPAPASP